MPVIVFFRFSVPDIGTFCLFVFHFRLGVKVFSVDLPLPVWWEINLSIFVELMDRKHKFSSWNRVPILSISWDISTSSLMAAILDFSTPDYFPFGRTRLLLSLFYSWTLCRAYSRWNFVDILCTSWYINFGGLEAAILDFLLPVTFRG